MDACCEIAFFASGDQGLFLKKPPLSVKHPQKLLFNFMVFR
jgi:hypothetical protein